MMRVRTMTFKRNDVWLTYLAWWFILFLSMTWVTLFFNISPIFLGGFLHFMCQWKQEWIFYRMGTNLHIHFLTVSLIVAVVSLSAVRNDRGRRLPAVHSIEVVVWTFIESRPMFVYLIFVRLLLDESFKENLLDSCRFWSKFYLQNLTYSHIPFHCYIITHDVTRWSEQCGAFMTSSVR